MQCRRCKTNFDYDIYYGICPKCAYFNRPAGMEEIDLFEDDERFAREEDYRMPQEETHQELHRKYDENPRPHKKTQSNGSWQKQIERHNKYPGSKIMIVFIVLIIVITVLASVLLQMFKTYRTSGEVKITKTSEKTDEKEGFLFESGKQISLPNGQYVVFEDAQPVAAAGDIDGLPQGKKIICIKASVTQGDMEDVEYLSFDGPAVKNSMLYCYPVDPLSQMYEEDLDAQTDDSFTGGQGVEAGGDSAESSLAEAVSLMENGCVEFNSVSEGENFFYYVVDDKLSETTIHLAAWSGSENGEPDYEWDVQIAVGGNANE